MAKLDTLVRFERSHDDDDDLVQGKYGPYPGAEAYFEQLRLELVESGFDRPLRLVHADMGNKYCSDVYTLYARTDSNGLAPPQLAAEMQRAYDTSGVAGFFQIIEQEAS